MSGELGKWDGQERRKEQIEFQHEIIRRLDGIEREQKYTLEKIAEVKKDVQHNHDSAKLFRAEAGALLFGDGTKAKPGIVATANNAARDITAHIVNDRWMHGIFVTILLAILGWTIFH